jgi:hypothetical protein
VNKLSTVLLVRVLIANCCSTLPSLRSKEGVPFGLALLKLVVWHPLFYLAQTVHCGWGLFARRDLTFAEVQAALYGFLTPIDVHTFTALRNAGHPSLFVTRSNQHYILHELLSLVNHQCKSKVDVNKTEQNKPRPFFLETGR